MDARFVRRDKGVSMTLSAFPTKLVTKGHFGRKPEDVVDLSVETDENRNLIYATQGLGLRHRLTASLDLTNQLADTPQNLELTRMLAEELAVLEEYTRIECSDCGISLRVALSGDQIIPEFECSEAGGMRPFSVSLAVPSGKIAFANDLRELVVVERMDVNTLQGRKRQTIEAAGAGLVMISVGNTCPSVIRSGSGFEIGIGFPKEQRLGSICTDLWWYCAMDWDFLVSRCEAKGISPEDVVDFTVDVEPGVYSFSDEIAKSEAGRVVFSRVSKVNDGAPSIRLSGVDAATTMSESQFWKTVTGRSNFVRRGMSVLGDIFCVSGGGLDWVEGGLRSVSGRDDDAPYTASLRGRTSERDDPRVPLLPQKSIGAIYPMSLDYPGKIGVVPADINVYWLAAAMVFAKSALAYPVVTIGAKSSEISTKQSDEVRAVLVASLDLLHEIAEVRGLWESGRLQQALDEFSILSAC